MAIDEARLPCLRQRRWAIPIGILANTMLKMAAWLVFGKARFRQLATIGLAGLALGSVLALVCL